MQCLNVLRTRLTSTGPQVALLYGVELPHSRKLYAAAVREDAALARALKEGVARARAALETEAREGIARARAALDARLRTGAT